MRKLHYPPATWASLLLLLMTLSRGVADDAGLHLFETSVRPVLVEKCLECHGPKAQESNLRLDSREAALRGGESGPAIALDKPEQSLLLKAIRHSGQLKMPPEAKLKDAQIAAIERWIKLGAPWPKVDLAVNPRAEIARQHWAFQPVRDPPVPTQFPAANPIDSFVHEKLSAAKLVASPRADRRTLIRRATFDLLGMPPTADEVDAFVCDDDPSAYARLIERLLASPHYGEQWGRHWLDVARYSDTKGYVYARENRTWVHAWAYRDWVTKSLNDDLPYDKFLLYQIAADQAAGDEKRHLAAMGFLTLGRRFLGVTHDIIDDRIDVLTRGTMGLTVACARCHDHKYDPIPAADYYSLYGVFQNCIERSVPAGEPQERDAAYQAFEQEWQKRQKKLDDLLLQRRNESAARVRERVGDYLMAQLELHKYPEEGFDQLLTKTDIIPEFVRHWQNYLREAAKNDDRIFNTWLALAAVPAEGFKEQAVAVLEALQRRSNCEVHPLVKERFRTPVHSHLDVATRYGQLFIEIETEWQAARAKAAENNEPLPTMLADKPREQLRQVLYGENSPCETPNAGIVNIEGFFDNGTVTELWKAQGEVDAWLIQSPLAPPQGLILEDRPIPLPAYVFKRGKAANKGAEAPRQFLAHFAGPNRKPFELGSGRLELAKAIIDPNNPLTPRVLVNRVWLHHFGAGLVRTPSDFGTRAEQPSHPELLDWLTSRFLAEGWSLKQLHRRIMLSGTYQQTSHGPEKKEPLATALQIDPENRLLWRMNQRRLTFEELRDAMFAATSELKLEIGGKPADLFNAGFKRRSLYGQIDRQFLPGTLRAFDFANPDLHIPQRTETTVPQQALFFLNHQLVLSRAQSLAKTVPATLAPTERVQQMFRHVYQRAASPEQVTAALALVAAKSDESENTAPATAVDWQYGFAEFDEQAQRNKAFTKLPLFNGTAWQGGPAWPDPKLGWVQLTADGGHAGNDVPHAAVRRWTAPRDMLVNISSVIVHDTAAGDGVRARIISSRHGLLKEARVHNNQAEMKGEQVELKAGDTLDFAVDIGGTLNNDQFTWEVRITPAVATTDMPVVAWNSRTDFTGPITSQLDSWEQLAQVLFSTNEFMFID
ncbi:Planctomycete cytochrome C [Anatilimnocola aggregata]|uniref:Planctomycete cytochrome C n=1 Tax=Anatilimnocola aggregata TaxID=2528021 RepID=A0A517Y548_9BACT|nr:PSD1 and planctomycete cytochrome C domain-containing protein [Anatilimnocola aggregata]QDU25369.1 Planctomycete cytochrome C [Anatilimnocola aggregata]